MFLSYVNEDRSIAERIASGLESAGFSVWWDRHIHGGVDFRKEIDRQLGAAKVVVVLWSTTSLESEWVCDEAQQARDHNKLIPVRLDSVQPPLGFRQAQSLDFGAWNGDLNAAPFTGLVNSARHFLAEGSTVTPVAPARPSAAAMHDRSGGSRARLLATTAIVIVMAAAIAVALMRNHYTVSGSSELTNGRVEIGTFDVRSKDDDIAHFAAGLRDTLGHAFSINGIKSVVADLSSASGNGDAASPAELLLRGSVDRVQGSFKISADLVRRHEGLVLWSMVTQGEAGEVDAVQKRFSSVVAEVLKCALNNRDLAKDDPSSDLLAKIVQYCGLFQGLGQLSQLEDLANQIVEIAPEYAISHVSRAVAGAIIAQQPAVLGALLKPEEEQKRLHKIADESAKKAIELEPQNKRIEALVDWALARKNYNAGSLRVGETMDLLERSVAADAQFGPARAHYAEELSRVGRIDESRTEFERAAGLIPLAANPNPTAEQAKLVAAFGNVSQGRQQLIDFEQRTGFSLDEDRFWLEYWYGDPEAAKALAQSGHIPEFVRPGYTGGVPRCRDALLDARIKRRPMSQAQFDAVCADTTPDMPAAFEAERGDVDAAFRELNIWTFGYVRNWYVSQTLFLPYMRSVRADPRFMPFAASIHLVDYWLDSGHWPDFCTTKKLPYDCKEAALAARANAGR